MFNHLELSGFSRLCSQYFETLDSYIATRKKELRERKKDRKLDGEGRSGVHLIKQRSLYWLYGLHGVYWRF